MTIPLSWASLEAFQDCKLRWKLQYLDDIRLPVNQKPFLVGSAVHDTLERWYKAGWNPGLRASQHPANIHRDGA